MLRRRTIGLWLITSIVLLLLLIALTYGPFRRALWGSESGDYERPNVVLIIGDDQGYTDFGFMGSAVARTPNLDRLAAEGTLFRLGFSTASTCRPALFSLLTGLHPIQLSGRAGLDLPQLFLPLRRPGDDLDPAVPTAPAAYMKGLSTLPRLLRSRGYESFMAGKYWEGDPLDAGFSASMGAEVVRETTQPVYRFIDEHSNEPFFVWFAPQIPHVPHDAPRRFFELYQEDGLSPLRLKYFASTSWLDHAVGDLVQHLETRGLLARTLIVFVTDNGWQASDHAPESEGRGVSLDAAALRAMSLGLVDSPRGKGSVFEMGVRTPIIFHGPGVVPSGRVHDSLASTVDLVATILDYAGAPKPAACRGRSLRPVIDAEVASIRDAVIGYMPVTESDPWGGYFVRTPDWYFIQFAERKSELFDMTTDPGQTRNVADAHPALVQRLAEMARDWNAENEGVSC